MGLRATVNPSNTLHDDMIDQLVLLQVVVHLSISDSALGSRLVTTASSSCSHLCNVLL